MTPEGEKRAAWKRGTDSWENRNLAERCIMRGAPRRPSGYNNYMILQAQGQVVIVQEIPMSNTQKPLFEYASHEGNHAVVNILRTARAEDKAASEAATGSHCSGIPLSRYRPRSCAAHTHRFASCVTAPTDIMRKRCFMSSSSRCLNSDRTTRAEHARG